jgi:hypothetical protein
MANDDIPSWFLNGLAQVDLAIARRIRVQSSKVRDLIVSEKRTHDRRISQFILLKNNITIRNLKEISSRMVVSMLDSGPSAANILIVELSEPCSVFKKKIFIEMPNGQRELQMNGRSGIEVLSNIDNDINWN